MKRLPLTAVTALLALVFAGNLVPQVTFAAIPEGMIAGHVWLDTNCDGHKNVGEGDVINAGVVQLVNTGSDRVLNKGDFAQTYYTDTTGHWQTGSLRVNGFDDQPVVWAIAVGTGSARALGYSVSPEGGDSILSGPTHASATFQLQDGVTTQMGEIGLCRLPQVFLPVVVKR